MPVLDLWYARPSDNIAPLAVLTGSAIAAGSARANAVDLDPASAVLFSGAGPNSWDLIFDFTGYAAYAPIRWAVVLGTNWAQSAGATRGMWFQANATNSWGAPTISVGFTLPPYTGSAFAVGVSLDLSAVSAYLNTHKYVRVLFSDSAAGVAPSVGEVFFSPTLRKVLDFEPEVEHARTYRTISHETPAGRRLSYSQDVRQRRVRGTQRYSIADFEQLLLLSDDARGSNRPFPIQRAQEEPIFVQLTDEIGAAHAFGRRSATLQFLEVVNDRVV